MKCLYCPVDMVSESYKDLNIHKCPQCEALWIEKDSMREFKDRTDEFLCWLDFDLWEEDEKHIVTKANKRCTCCGKLLHNVDYHGSHIVLPVCADCKGVWLDKKNSDKLFNYLEEVVTNETIAGFIKEIGHEALDLVKGQETLKTEIHDLKTILVLIEYRIFSWFPTMERIISGFPK